MSERAPDGRVWLTVPEAALLWRQIGSLTMSEGAYRRRCRSGVIQRKGIAVTSGPRFLTDMDSILDYFDREVTAMRVRLDEALQARKRELEEYR